MLLKKKKFNVILQCESYLDLDGGDKHDDGVLGRIILPLALRRIVNNEEVLLCSRAWRVSGQVGSVMCAATSVAQLCFLTVPLRENKAFILQISGCAICSATSSKQDCIEWDLECMNNTTHGAHDRV